MFTVRKLRNVAKQLVQNNQVCEALMFACVLLLKKGINQNHEVISSLKQKQNIYSLDFFHEFTITNDFAKIIENLDGDTKIYNIFEDQMKTKFL